MENVVYMTDMSAVLSSLYMSYNSNDFFLFLCFTCSQSALVCMSLMAKCFYVMNISIAGFLYLPVSEGLSPQRRATGCRMNSICWRSCVLILSVRYHFFYTGNLPTKKIDCSAVHVNFKYAA